MTNGAEHERFPGGPARSKQLLQLVIDSIPQRVFWKDRASAYLGCNRSFARDAGLDDPALIVGKTDFELAWKATAHLYVADDRLVMESTMAKVDIEEPMKFTDGRTIWLRTSKVPLHDESGAVFGVLGTYEDITEQRQAANDLQESEERFRATFEQAAVGIAHVAQDGRWLRVNRRLCEMVGYTREELLAGTFQEITHPDDLPADLENVRKVLAGDIQTYSMDKRYIRKDRTEAWIALTVSLARDADGRPKYFISVIEDITGRKRAEEALARSELLFRSLIENALDLIVVVAADGAVRYVSPSVERILGYDPARVGDLNVFDLIHPDDLAEAKEKLRRALETGTRFEQVGLRVRRSDGSWRTLSMMGKPSPPAVGACGLIINARDVTEGRALEEQLRQSQKMEAVGRLAGGIAHDFNNLLTTILGYAEIAAGRLKPEDPSRLELSEIDKAAQRAADLTRQLLAFSRKQVLELRVIDLNRVVSDTNKMLRRLIGEDIELVVSLKELLGSVKADTGQIEQVLLNLAVNSRDAMPNGGKLTIETSEVELDETYSVFHFDDPPGRYVLLAVSDTGTGMDAKTLSHVFEPFFTTKEAGKGTGLGLSTVYGVVKQSGGHVTVYSEPGVGTTFKIYLPRVGDAPEKDRASVAHAALAGGTETILVVEDEEAVRRLTCRSLEAQGYEILPAASVREALLLCEKYDGEIHLLITDVVMPDGSGRELARSAAALRPLMKVLFMSGYTDDVIVHHGVLDAGTAFLQKPFTPHSLSQKVRQVLDAEEQSPEDP